MISALLSFLGGSVFRMLWGEISAMLTARQEHRHEVERLRLQGELEAAQHARMQDSIRLQHELGVRAIAVQAEADQGRVEAGAWADVSRATSVRTGLHLVDGWNGIIRPLVATVCLALWVLHVSRQGWVLDENGWQLLGAALGIYLADRALFKRGK